MFHLVKDIPKEPFLVAVSGGQDSMVFLDYLMRYPKHQFELLYFNHSTEHGAEAEQFLIKFCAERNLVLHIGRITRERIKGESPEEYWRKQRYSFFESFDKKIITCHHLNDVMETFLFSSFNGTPKIIPSERGQYLRPFLAVSKHEIEKWGLRNNVRFVEDPSNVSTKYARNRIRHLILPQVLKINPGFGKVMKKKVLQEKFDSSKEIS